MYWLETIYNEVNGPEELKMTNFDKDLWNGRVFGALLETYVGEIGVVKREIYNLLTKFNSTPHDY